MGAGPLRAFLIALVHPSPAPHPVVIVLPSRKANSHRRQRRYEPVDPCVRVRPSISSGPRARVLDADQDLVISRWEWVAQPACRFRKLDMDRRKLRAGGRRFSLAHLKGVFDPHFVMTMPDSNSCGTNPLLSVQGRRCDVQISEIDISEESRGSRGSSIEWRRKPFAGQVIPVRWPSGGDDSTGLDTDRMARLSVGEKLAID